MQSRCMNEPAAVASDGRMASTTQPRAVRSRANGRTHTHRCPRRPRVVGRQLDLLHGDPVIGPAQVNMPPRRTGCITSCTNDHPYADMCTWLMKGTIHCLCEYCRVPLNNMHPVSFSSLPSRMHACWHCPPPVIGNTAHRSLLRRARAASICDELRVSMVTVLTSFIMSAPPIPGAGPNAAMSHTMHLRIDAPLHLRMQSPRDHHLHALKHASRSPIRVERACRYHIDACMHALPTGPSRACIAANTPTHASEARIGLRHVDRPAKATA